MMISAKTVELNLTTLLVNFIGMFRLELDLKFWRPQPQEASFWYDWSIGLPSCP